VDQRPVLVIQPEHTDPLGPLGEWLRSGGIDLEVLAPGQTPLPDDLDGYAGLVVLGGTMNANDDLRTPWLPGVRALLAEAVAKEVPTLGVGLGGQLLAVASGGRVGPNPDGPEIGPQLIAKRANAATDPLFGPLPITPDVISWHDDAVLVLPPGAVLLANSPTCEVQAFRVGRLAWGIQFHIETTPELIRAWVASAGAALEGYDLDRLLARTDAVHADIAEVWAPFAGAFAAIVLDPGSVAPVRPLRISTAAPITDPAEIRAALAAQMQAAHQPPAASALPWPGTESPPQR